jgi:hypothetical protein
MVDINIEEQIAASVRASVEAYLQSVDLNTVIADTLQKQIGNVVGNLTNKVLAQILANRDLEAEVTKLVNTILTTHLMDLGNKSVNNLIQQTDFAKLIVSSVQSEVHKVAGSYDFPAASIPFSSINLSGAKFPASQLDNSTIPSLYSTGITDTSEKTQLVITNDGIVVTDNITSENLLVADNLFTKNLTVEGNFSILGEIIDSQPLQNYVERVSTVVSKDLLKQYNTQDVDLTGRNLIADGRVIIANDSLGPQIVNSNLRKVGNLTELSVSGQAIIAETLVVTDSQVGINTESPVGALSVWDEDSEISFVKVAPKRMFAGSTRFTDLSLGTNNKEQITLKANGEIDIRGSIRFNGLLIGPSDTVPEKIGEPGEIAILPDGSMYRCEGQNRWSKM